MADDPTIQTAPSAPGQSYEGAAIPAQAPEQPERSAPFGKPEDAPALPGNLPNYQEDWQSGNAGTGLSPKPTKWDKVLGGIQQGYRGSMLGGTIPAYLWAKSAETGSTLTAEQANKLNPDRETPYTTPVDSGIVAMEAADARKRQQLSEWLGRNEGGNTLRSVGGFVGGLTDVPLYMAVGALTGGIGDAVLPEMGAAARVATHLAGNLAEFSGVGQVQNKMEASMGAKEKPFHEVVMDSVPGAVIATGLGMLSRRFLNRGEGTPEQIKKGVGENIVSMANDERPPDPPAGGGALAERKAGVQLDPSGDRVQPALQTSPLHETPLYAATHGDGRPLVHEHGLGQGTQFTDTREVANNGVSKSTDTPGQIGETKLPENAKLLDIDTPATEKLDLVKAIEQKTGVPLDAAVKDGESLKSIITNLGDWEGAEIAGGKKVPENVLSQIQEVMKEQGYNGYTFEGQNSRTVHMFDPKADGMEVSNMTHADPSVTPDDPTPAPPSSPEEAAAQAKQRAQSYSPATQEALNQIRKNAMTMHPDDLTQQIADTEAKLAEHKQVLAQMVKDHPELEDTMKELREDEAHDKRMLDVAKRIMNCGASE